jgi:uncharacterized protein (DUF1778 family)
MVDERDTRTGSELEGKGTVSFSVRLSENQRDLLARAAEAKGWTITNLLKNAALEKAAFILNTAAPNRIDFRGIARKVADQVFANRSARTFDMDGEIVDADVFDKLDAQVLAQQFVYPVEVSPWSMPSTFFTEIRDAARYGGTEFLSLIIDSSEAIAVRSQPNLPDPIDPNTV